MTWGCIPAARALHRVDERRRRFGGRRPIHGRPQKTISPTTSALSRANLGAPTIQPASSTKASRLSGHGCVPWLDAGRIRRERLVDTPEAGEELPDSPKKASPASPPSRQPLLLQLHHTAADTFDKGDPRHLNENAATWLSWPMRSPTPPTRAEITEAPHIPQLQTVSPAEDGRTRRRKLTSS